MHPSGQTRPAGNGQRAGTRGAYADAMRTAKSANDVPSASALALISFFIVIAASRRSLSLRSRAILTTASAESCCFRLRLSRTACAS